MLWSSIIDQSFLLQTKNVVQSLQPPNRKIRQQIKAPETCQPRQTDRHCFHKFISVNSRWPQCKRVIGGFVFHLKTRHPGPPQTTGFISSAPSSSNSYCIYINVSEMDTVVKMHWWRISIHFSSFQTEPDSGRGTHPPQPAGGEESDRTKDMMWKRARDQ